LYRKKEDECSLPEDERSELEAELECPVCLGMRIRVLIPVSQAHGRRNFKDTNPLMSSLLVIFVWGGEAIF
jgi:hypothetical protein